MVPTENSCDSNDTNWQLMKDGKSEALSALFHEHYKSIFQYGKKLTNYDTELTKEIIQNLFVKLWERRATLGDVQSEKVYLFTAFRRELIDKQRRLNVEEGYLASLNLNDYEEDSPEDLLLIEEKGLTDAQKIKNAMNKLPKRIKEAITLRYFEEMEYAEIAEIMNLKERTVYNFVHEGINLLRKELTLLVFIYSNL